MHPALRILAYACSALVIPGLNFFQLLALCIILLPAAFARRDRLLLLFIRTRLLFLVMLLVYAYAQPGAALLPWLGDWSPSREGSLAGLRQAWHLATLLLMLDLFVLRMPVPVLLTGIHGVLRPLAALGLDAQRVAMRLALTLQAMEKPSGFRGLRRLLEEGVTEGGPGDPVELTTRPFRMADWFALGLLMLGLMLWFTV